MKLEEISRKILTARDGEENQEIKDIDESVIEERIRNENGPMELSETEVRVRVETEITNGERLIIDELKVLMIRNEREEYLPFKKVDQRKLRDVTRKVNAVIRHIEINRYNSNKQTCYGSSPLGCERSWSEERQKRKKKPWWKRRIENDITSPRRDINKKEKGK